MMLSLLKLPFDVLESVWPRLYFCTPLLDTVRPQSQVHSSRRFQRVSASAQLGRMDRIFERKSPFFVTHPFFFLSKKAEKAQRL